MDESTRKMVQSGVRGNTTEVRTNHTIPVRVMNRPPFPAVVSGTHAMWRCVCSYATLLEAQSGDIAGPTLDSVAVCEHCGKVYFVIPQSVSKGPPIEVVELFGLPPS